MHLSSGVLSGICKALVQSSVLQHTKERKVKEAEKREEQREKSESGKVAEARLRDWKGDWLVTESHLRACCPENPEL